MTDKDVRDKDVRDNEPRYSQYDMDLATKPLEALIGRMNERYATNIRVLSEMLVETRQQARAALRERDSFQSKWQGASTDNVLLLRKMAALAAHFGFSVDTIRSLTHEQVHDLYVAARRQAAAPDEPPPSALQSTS